MRCVGTIDLNHYDDPGAAGNQHDRDHHAVKESPA
jgi:hypothetical protein